MKRRKDIPSVTDDDKLEKFVVGDSSTFIRSLSKPNKKGKVEASDDHRTPAWQDPGSTMTVEQAMKAKGNLTTSSSEDYETHLRRKFVAVHGTPTWAEIGDNREEEDDLLKSAGAMLDRTSDVTKGVIDIRRLANLNSETRNEGPIVTNVEFYKQSTIALVAGVSGVASLFQVDGKANKKLTSVSFEKYPIRCAQFTPDGKGFIVGSNLHSHFYYYDMVLGESRRGYTHGGMRVTNFKHFRVSPSGDLMAVAGKFGSIHLFTVKSHELLATLQMNGTVSCLSFNSDGSKLYSFGDSAEVYVWNMTSRRLEHKFIDEGCLSGMSLAVSPCDSYIATGCSSGVVNLYETRAVAQSDHPKPVKAFMNLVTAVTTLKFNPDSQLLAMASREKSDAIKIAHVPSLTVYKNFPLSKVSLNNVETLDFSPLSGYLCIGNNRRDASLYRLSHYKSY